MHDRLVGGGFAAEDTAIEDERIDQRAPEIAIRGGGERVAKRAPSAAIANAADRKVRDEESIFRWESAITSGSLDAFSKPDQRIALQPDPDDARARQIRKCAGTASGKRKGFGAAGDLIE